jgi:hypothetical protein
VSDNSGAMPTAISTSGVIIHARSGGHRVHSRR